MQSNHACTTSLKQPPVPEAGSMLKCLLIGQHNCLCHHASTRNGTTDTDTIRRCTCVLYIQQQTNRFLTLHVQDVTQHTTREIQYSDWPNIPHDTSLWCIPKTPHRMLDSYESARVWYYHVDLVNLGNNTIRDIALKNLLPHT